MLSVMFYFWYAQLFSYTISFLRGTFKHHTSVSMCVSAKLQLQNIFSVKNNLDLQWSQCKDKEMHKKSVKNYVIHISHYVLKFNVHNAHIIIWPANVRSDIIIIIHCTYYYYTCAECIGIVTQSTVENKTATLV